MIETNMGRRQMLGLMVGVVNVGIMGVGGHNWFTPDSPDFKESMVYIYGRIRSPVGSKSCAAIKCLTPARYEQHLDSQLAQLKQEMMAYMTPRLEGNTAWEITGTGEVPDYLKNTGDHFL